MAETTDAIVVGAGVLGCAVTLALSRRGLNVTCVDMAPNAGMGSTSYSSALVRFHYSTLVGTAVAWEAKHRWESWADYLQAASDAPLATYRRTGMLVLDTPDLGSRRALPHFEVIGIPYDDMDAAEIRDRFPPVDPSRYWPPRRVEDPGFWAGASGDLGAFYSSEGGFVDDPVLATANLKASAEAAGARFWFGSRVVKVEQSAGKVKGVELADARVLSAPVVVNVGGPNSHQINEIAGVLHDFTISTRALRQEVHVLPAPPGYSLHSGSPFVTDADLGIYFGPQPGDRVLVGGLEAPCDPLEWVDDPDGYNRVRTTELWDTYSLRLARRLPELRIPQQPSGAAGLYDATDDWLPIYDCTSVEGYFVAIGTSGNQFKNAPIVGDLMAELITRVQDGVDHDNDPVTVPGPITGIPIDLGTFSRRRSPADTSGSVLG